MRKLCVTSCLRACLSFPHPAPASVCGSTVSTARATLSSSKVITQSRTLHRRPLLNTIPDKDRQRSPAVLRQKADQTSECKLGELVSDRRSLQAAPPSQDGGYCETHACLAGLLLGFNPICIVISCLGCLEVEQASKHRSRQCPATMRRVRNRPKERGRNEPSPGQCSGALSPPIPSRLCQRAANQPKPVSCDSVREIRSHLLGTVPTPTPTPAPTPTQL